MVHIFVRFVGGADCLMNGTGIFEDLGVLYAGNKASHLLSRKAIDRSLRDHQLLDLVFNTILLENLLSDLDVSFIILENMMTYAKDDRLDSNNAVQCDSLSIGRNAFSEKNILRINYRILGAIYTLNRYCFYVHLRTEIWRLPSSSFHIGGNTSFSCMQTQ